ncbi:8-oxo-dGTP diphosphatase [Candidatus Kaiserbacteria bacterium]|nr:8-oxo-dGTP diphosphatase [Candidatus Kaiserbacteria bacterium]
MRQDTLLFLLKDDTQEILLAMKKRGFGVGKLNGVGGKVAPGESIEAAAVREAREEIVVVVQESDLLKVGELTFHFAGKPDSDINAHVFFTRVWNGEPTESEEMAPEWFDRAAIPFEKMWVDDKYWLPLVLRGEYVTADFLFNHEGSALLKYTIEGAPL